MTEQIAWANPDPTSLKLAGQSSTLVFEIRLTNADTWELWNRPREIKDDVEDWSWLGDFPSGRNGLIGAIKAAQAYQDGQS